MLFIASHENYYSVGEKSSKLVFASIFKILDRNKGRKNNAHTNRLHMSSWALILVSGYNHPFLIHFY